MKGFEKVSADIDGWCSGSTIQRWLDSHHDYDTYVERILPLLSKAQMVKHVVFSSYSETIGTYCVKKSCG
jgi:hypothetical protein